MLQRDLARQVRREGEPMPVSAAAGVRRLDKTEVESAWHRAKLEMETDDFLDVLADNLSGKWHESTEMILFYFVYFLFFIFNWYNI